MSIEALTDAARVRLLVASAASRRQLAGVIERLAPGVAVGRVALTRCTFKPGRTLRAYYDIGLGELTWPVSATWRAARPAAGTDATRGVAGGATRQVAPPPPFVALSAHASTLGAHIQVWPHDRAFPQVAPLVDHYRRRGASVSVVRYRPGQRHVLRLVADRAPALYLKVAGGLDRALLDAVLAEAGATMSRRQRATLVGPVSLPGPSFGAVAYPSAGSSAVSSLATSDGSGVLLRALEALGELAAALHQVGPGAGADGPAALPSRTRQDELDLVVRACEHVVALAPELGSAVDQVVAAARDMAGPDDLHLVHGDLKLDHLFATRDGIRLIDLDGFRLADPASDVAKLRAELHFLEVDGRRPGAGAAIAAFERGYRRGGPEDVSHRAALLEPALLFKMAARRVSLADRRWRDRVSAVVAHAQHLADTAGIRATSRVVSRPLVSGR